MRYSREKEREREEGKKVGRVKEKREGWVKRSSQHKLWGAMATRFSLCPGASGVIQCKDRPSHFKRDSKWKMTEIWWSFGGDSAWMRKRKAITFKGYRICIGARCTHDDHSEAFEILKRLGFYSNCWGNNFRMRKDDVWQTIFFFFFIFRENIVENRVE